MTRSIDIRPGLPRRSDPRCRSQPASRPAVTQRRNPISVCEDQDQSIGKRVRVGRFEEESSVTGDLGDRPGPSRDDRASVRHRLERRKPEPFEERRVHEHRRGPVDPGQVVVVAADEAHSIGQAARPTAARSAGVAGGPKHANRPSDPKAPRPRRERAASSCTAWNGRRHRNHGASEKGSGRAWAPPRSRRDE